MRSLCATVLAVCFAWPLAALAQDADALTPPDADALIVQGIELRREHRDEEALAAFRRAHELTPSPRALAQIALAEQAMGAWIDAHAHLIEALASEADPWIAARRDALRGSLEIIEARLGRLELRGEAEGAEVRVDGTARGTMPLREPLWVPAGRIVVEVRAEGHHRFNRSVEVSPGGHARVVVQLVSLTEASASEAPVSIERGGGGVSPLVVVGGVALGLAAIPLGVGIGFHVAREDDAQYFQSDECLQAGMTRAAVCPGELAAIRDAEVAMGVGYGVAGALAIVGVVLVAIAPPSGDTETALSCGAGPGELGVACAARF